MDKIFNIAMVSDFFYPNVGGVECHIYELSQCLLARGHNVIVITHAYNAEKNFSRQGIRYFSNFLKVYYIPFRSFYNQCCLPTMLNTLPIIREILIREQIQIVHSHSAFSTLALETIMHAKTMGLCTVFTDHSLFGFADVSSILMNRLLQWALMDVDCAICVSHTSKENTVLRARVSHTKVHVIPNAIHAAAFTPDPSRIDKRYVTIVVVSRLVYRKGVDLLCAAIPTLCTQYPQVRFIIAGDGPKRVDLEEIRENNNLYSRMELLGALKNHEIRDVLTRGDIFISTSLTEAFCIAIVEAACCGLRVVSTNVGGVREVLPGHLIRLCEPTKRAVIEQTILTVEERLREIADSRSPINEVTLVKERMWHQHKQVANLYTWTNVAQRTDVIYQQVARLPAVTISQRLRMHSSVSVVGGKILILLLLMEMLLFYILSFVRPKKKIEYLAGVESKQ